MKKIVSLGEIMLRLSPPNNNKFDFSNIFEVSYGGGEANVAVALSQYGLSSSFISKIPKNPLGDCAYKHLRKYNVNCDFIVKGEERLGIYFLENGYSIRNSKVVYDRKDSAINHLKYEEIDWVEAFNSASIFHISGITLALSESSFELSKKAILKAKEMGLKVSFDFNYRSKLWSLSQAGKKIEEIINNVDIVFASHLDFINILKFDFPLPQKNNSDYYNKLYSKISKKYNFEVIITSLRKVISANRNFYSGLVYKDSKIYKGREYDIEIIDRVGTGDAFTAGFLYAYINDYPLKKSIEFAIGSGALKHTIKGDVVKGGADEVEDFISSPNFKINR